MIGLVIFDCDGVLVDSERLAFEELLKLLQKNGVALTLDEAVPLFLGTSRKTTLQTVSRLTGKSIDDDFYEEFLKNLLPRFQNELKPVSGVENFVTQLKQKMIPFCVASSGDPQKIKTSLTATNLWNDFKDRVFSAVQVQNGKPAPDLFLLAAEKCGVPPSQCLVIEDSRFGVEAAKAAGMTCVGLSDLVPGNLLHKADYVIRSYKEFPETLLTSVHL